MELPKEEIPDLKPKTSLIKKESKRTTFKLSAQSLNAIDWMVDYYNMTAKEVFDSICSGDSIVEYAVKFAKESEGLADKELTRKTFVISQQALGFLNKTSDEQKISRDLLVNKLILIYKVLLDRSIEQEEKNEEKALKIIHEFWKEAEELETQLKALLGDEHPILTRLGTISIIIGNLYGAIESKLSDGTPIDPYDM